MIDLVYDKAIKEILELVNEARNRGIDATAGALSTARSDGKPSVRMVNVVRIASTGVVFFADLESGKAQQLTENPFAAICFYWEPLHQQIIIEGSVAVLDMAASADLWQRVPRDYALGHWASTSSSAGDIRQHADEYRKQFKDNRVPLPPNWRAFEIQPSRIALWTTGWERLRQRTEYLSGPEGWLESKLNP